MEGLTARLAMEEMQETPLLQYQALAEFRYQIRKFLHFSEMAAQAAGLEPQQHQLLLIVKGFRERAEGPTIGYIAERLQVRHHSAVELVTRMEARGFVFRRTGNRDRRKVIVALTNTGETLLKTLSPHHIAEIREIAPALVAALHQVLDACPGGGEDS